MHTDHIRFKDGVQWRLSHSQPAFQRILEVALECAPETTDGTLWVTELWREPRRALDLHTLCLAVDFRIHNFVVDSELPEDKAYVKRREKAWGFVNWMRDTHDDRRYQFAVHGSGRHIAMDPTIHIHAEFDPR